MPPVEPPRRVLWLAASLVVLTGVWTLAWKRPLGTDGWYLTPHLRPWPVLACSPMLGCLLLAGGFAGTCCYDRFCRAGTPRQKKASTAMALGGLALLAGMLPWAMALPTGGFNLVAATWSDVSNGYFSEASRMTSARSLVRNYNHLQIPRSSLQAHVATHPPGAILWYYGLRRNLEALPALESGVASFTQFVTGQSITEVAAQANSLRLSAARSAGDPSTPQSLSLPLSAVAWAMWASFVSALMLALAVPAVYMTASRPLSTEPDEVAAAQARGLFAAALFALAPSLAFFGFSLDALVTCGAAWALATASLGHSGSRWWYLLCGVMVGLTSFVSFGALAILPLIMLGLCLAPGADSPRSKPFGPALVVAGFVLLWLLLVVLLPMNPLVIFTKAMTAHANATLRPRIHRWAWVPLDIVIFGLFCGWPLTCLLIAGIPAARLRRSLPAAFGLSALCVIGLLLLSGSVRGEVERLWMFLVAPMAVLASGSLQDSRGSCRVRSGWTILLLLQGLQAIVMFAALSPLVLPL